MWGNLISAVGDVAGGLISADASKKAAAMNIKYQKEFAQQGIRWRVADAQAAGIHPLAALGAQTHSFQPVAVGNHMGDAIANAGQDIGRAVDAMRTPTEKADAVQKSIQALQLERAGLENQLLAAQIAKIKQPASPPGMPSLNPNAYLIPGQGQTAKTNSADLVKDDKMERTASHPTATHAEPGAITDIGYTRTQTGWAPVLSKDAKERYEEDLPGVITWNIRNRLLPSVGINQAPPPFAPPEGKRWHWNPVKMEYVLVNDGPLRRGYREMRNGPLVDVYSNKWSRYRR